MSTNAMNIIRCSQTELTALLTKAAVASGCPIGVAEEVARAGCLLQGQDNRGVALTLAALAQVARERSTENLEEGSISASLCLQYDSIAVAVAGPSLLDIAIAAGLESPATLVSVDKLDSLPLLLALMIVRHQDTGLGFELILSDDSRVRADASQICIIADLSEAQKNAIGLYDDLSALYGPVKLSLIQGQITTESRNIPAGGIPAALSVNASDWTAAARLAHRTYVPASESSRLGGAGAGLTDND